MSCKSPQLVALSSSQSMTPSTWQSISTQIYSAGENVGKEAIPALLCYPFREIWLIMGSVMTRPQSWRKRRIVTKEDVHGPHHYHCHGIGHRCRRGIRATRVGNEEQLSLDRIEKHRHGQIDSNGENRKRQQRPAHQAI